MDWDDVWSRNHGVVAILLVTCGPRYGLIDGVFLRHLLLRVQNLLCFQTGSLFESPLLHVVGKLIHFGYVHVKDWM